MFDCSVQDSLDDDRGAEAGGATQRHARSLADAFRMKVPPFCHIPGFTQPDKISILIAYLTQSAYMDQFFTCTAKENQMLAIFLCDDIFKFTGCLLSKKFQGGLSRSEQSMLICSLHSLYHLSLLNYFAPQQLAIVREAQHSMHSFIFCVLSKLAQTNSASPPISLSNLQRMLSIWSTWEQVYGPYRKQDLTFEQTPEEQFELNMTAAESIGSGVTVPWLTDWRDSLDSFAMEPTS